MKYPTYTDWQNLQIIWDYLVVRDNLPTQIDTLVLGGAAKMTDMAQYAAQLWHERDIKCIIVSGYAGKLQDLNMSEASLMREVLIANDVPDSVIYSDKQASNTGENITHSAKILQDLDKSPESIGLIHKPFMTRRFKATAEAQWPDSQPNFYVTCVDMKFRDYFMMHNQAYPDDPERIIRSMLGDYERIKKYPESGFSSTQPVSEDAENAYIHLLKAGFAIRRPDDDC